MKPTDHTTSAHPVLRPHAEHEFAHELVALAAADIHERPPNWRLSPWAVVSALARVDPASPSIGLAYALTDLAALRRHMLTELEPA